VPTAQGIVNGGFPATGSGGLLSVVPPGYRRCFDIEDTTDIRTRLEDTFAMVEAVF